MVITGLEPWAKQGIRVGAGLAIGALVGLERGFKLRGQKEGSRVAGVRTFTLLGLGSGLPPDRHGASIGCRVANRRSDRSARDRLCAEADRLSSAAGKACQSEILGRVAAGLAKRLASSLSGWKGSRRLATASRTPSRYRAERWFESSW